MADISTPNSSLAFWGAVLPHRFLLLKGNIQKPRHH
jgi:hypothetical protein